MKLSLAVSSFVLASMVLAGCGPMATHEESKQLAKVEYTVRAMYEGHERTMIIAPSGDLLLKEQMHDTERNITSAITPDERADLLGAFQGWNKLSGTYTVDVSPQITIIYNGKSVTTSRPDTVPEPFGRAKAVLDKIAIALSVAADAKTEAEGKAAGSSSAPVATAPAGNQ